MGKYRKKSAELGSYEHEASRLVQPGDPDCNVLVEPEVVVTKGDER